MEQRRLTGSRICGGSSSAFVAALEAPLIWSQAAGVMESLSNLCGGGCPALLSSPPQSHTLRKRRCSPTHTVTHPRGQILL